LDKFQYAMASQQQGGGWGFSGPHGTQGPFPTLLGLLNNVGGQGWEVVGAGEFVGGGANEVLLKKRVRDDAIRR
jgi:hypothetical protein